MLRLRSSQYNGEAHWPNESSQVPISKHRRLDGVQLIN